MQERPDKKTKNLYCFKIMVIPFFAKPLCQLLTSAWKEVDNHGQFRLCLHLAYHTDAWPLPCLLAPRKRFFPTIQFSTFFTRAALSGCFDFMWEAIPELEAFLEVQPTFPLLTSFWQWRHQTSRKSPKCFNRFIFTLAHNLKIYLQLFQNETTTNYEVFLFPAS